MIKLRKLKLEIDLMNGFKIHFMKNHQNRKIYMNNQIKSVVKEEEKEDKPGMDGKLFIIMIVMKKIVIQINLLYYII